MDLNLSRNFWTERDDLLLRLHELLFAANVVCAVGYGLSLYVSLSIVPWTPMNDAGYYFLRGALRVSDILHLGAANPVSSDAVARGESIIWNQTAIATTLVITVWSAASVVFLLVRGLNAGNHLTFRRIAAFAALFAGPAGCLVVRSLTLQWPSGLGPGEGPPERSLFWFLFYVFIGELFVFLVLFLAGRKHSISAWVSGSLLFLHSAWWGFFLFQSLPIYIRGARAVYLIHVVLWLIPSMGAAWLLYVWPGPATQPELSGKREIGKWTIFPAMFGTVALLALWLPSRSHAAAQPKDPKSAVIVLSRGPCFGSCPAYTISIHGDGAVEYQGQRFVKVTGKQTASLNSQDFANILHRLDQVHFFTLEDRAFAWCFDTSSVSITVSVDGKTKRVTSDAGCSGAKSGVQDEFVTAAHDIDQIVDSSRWVRCDGDCRQ
jgi:hypothetical protein